MAAETGETLTEAVIIALRERLDREHAGRGASMRTRLARLTADVAALPVAALVRLMPAAIRVEPGIVIEARLWPAGQDVVDRFLRDAKIDIVAVDEDLAARAMSGWRRYGQGRHPAGLNFSDCFTYALAERTGVPRALHRR